MKKILKTGLLLCIGILLLQSGGCGKTLKPDFSAGQIGTEERGTVERTFSSEMEEESSNPDGETDTKEETEMSELPEQSEEPEKHLDIANLPFFSYREQEMEVTNDGRKIYGIVCIPDTEQEKVPLILCAHGLGGSYQSNLSYAREFASHGIAACTFDFRGGGGNKSEGVQTEMSVMTEVSDLECVLAAAETWDFVDGTKIGLFGVSQGGVVAAITAARHEDEVAGLMLFCPAFMIRDVVRLYFLSPDNIPDSYAYRGLTIGKVYAEDMWDYDVYAEMGDYRKKVLLVHGTEDEIVPVSYSKRAAECYEDVEYYEVEGAGHAFDGAAEKVTEYVFGYLREIDFLPAINPLSAVYEGDYGMLTKADKDRLTYEISFAEKELADINGDGEEELLFLDADGRVEAILRTENDTPTWIGLSDGVDYYKRKYVDGYMEQSEPYREGAFCSKESRFFHYDGEWNEIFDVTLEAVCAYSRYQIECGNLSDYPGIEGVGYYYYMKTDGSRKQLSFAEYDRIWKQHTNQSSHPERSFSEYEYHDSGRSPMEYGTLLDEAIDALMVTDETVTFSDSYGGVYGVDSIARGDIANDGNEDVAIVIGVKNYEDEEMSYITDKHVFVFTQTESGVYKISAYDFVGIEEGFSRFEKWKFCVENGELEICQGDEAGEWSNYFTFMEDGLVRIRATSWDGKYNYYDNYTVMHRCKEDYISGKYAYYYDYYPHDVEEKGYQGEVIAESDELRYLPYLYEGSRIHYGRELNYSAAESLDIIQAEYFPEMHKVSFGYEETLMRTYDAILQYEIPRYYYADDGGNVLYFYEMANVPDGEYQVVRRSGSTRYRRLRFKTFSSFPYVAVYETPDGVGRYWYCAGSTGKVSEMIPIRKAGV